jgi:glucosamine--fructose-6-phosphate aminotransferase (isomerizing)
MGMRTLADDLEEKGALLLALDPRTDGKWAQFNNDRAEADAVCLITAFYGMAVRLAELRGTDADRPRHLTKVTRTR